ncbi:hypothetical protein BGW37DRAFT_489225 [Umbelopsis sp. PMI_123]|nr:hypothetical protein BGW37DRAFT_489225 [Umbelopsis sp. PMI_123]
MPAMESTTKAEKKRTGSETTNSNTTNAPDAKKRKLTPAEALIKSMTARKAIASQKKATGTHVTFGDNDEVIEKKVAGAVPEENQKNKNKKKKKGASKQGSGSATTTTSTASIFQNDSTGSILPTNSAIDYLRTWKSDRASWKFQKVRQIWLLANLYDEVKISDEDFTILLAYIQDLKGKARQATIEEATQIHQQYPDQDDSESETDQPVAGGVDDHDDDEFDAEKMMAKAQKQAQNVKVQEQKQEQQVAKKKAVRAMEILRTLS